MGAREMVQWVRILAALQSTGVQFLVPTQYLTAIYKSNPRGTSTFSWPLWLPGMYVAYELASKTPVHISSFFVQFF